MVEIKEIEKEDLSKGRIILYFYQDGCKPCEEMKPSIQHAADALDWKVYKVKLKDHQDLVRKYSVNSTPTFVYIVDGKVCAKQIGMCMGNCLEQKVCDDTCPEIISESEFEERVLKNKKDVIVEFVKNNCGNCKAMEQTVKDTKKLMPEVDIFIIDPTNEFVKKFNLKNSPTFIGFRNGQVIGNAVGVIPDLRVVFNPKKVTNGFSEMATNDLKALAYDIQEELKRRTNGN